MKEFPPKAPTERVPLTFEFDEQLADGETLTTSTVTIRATRGLDASPAAVLFGGPTIVGTVVQHLVAGGVLAEIYEVTCTANTTSQILVLRGTLPVRDPSDT